eukprot:SAG22_NODE_533_length_9401_cov_5.643625_4_plen_40_part_00
MGDESLVEQMEKLQVGDVVRLTAAKGSLIIFSLEALSLR